MTRTHRLLSPLLLSLAAFAPAQDPAPTTVKVTGRVVTWQGQPISGAAVAYAREGEMTTAQLLKEPQLRTDADGKFEARCPIRGDKNDPEPPMLMVAHKGMAAIGIAVNFRHKDMGKDVKILPREDTDLGDLVLPEGTRLIGRVRDADGNGLANVRVTARDLLQNHRALPGPSTNCRCIATTDASGIFSLPATLSSAVALEFFAAGHYRTTLAPAGEGAPLEVTLQKSGEVRGRVLDHEGRGVEGALVSANYERRGTASKTRTTAAGEFVMTLDHDARFRLAASRSHDAPDGKRSITRTATSGVMRGTQAQVELQLAAAEESKGAADDTAKLRVEAVDAAGNPVAGMRAAVSWQKHALNNASYLEYVFTQGLQRCDPSQDNAADVVGPQDEESSTGVVRVVAKGFAPATQRDIEWAAIEGEAKRPPVIVRMTKESSVSGRVLDERTGAPIAGAQVWALPQFDPSQGSYNSGRGAPDDAQVTGADGSFRIGELGEGGWIVRFQHKDRPAAPASTVELKVEEHKLDVELKMPEGARIAGRVTGMTIPLGSKAFLHPLQTPRFGSSSFVSYSSSTQKPENAKPLATDGAFEFTGMALGNYLLVVDLPSPPRCGGSIAIPLEPIRVRREGIQRDFDGTADLPGTIRGRVTFARATPSNAALMVAAEQVGEDPNEQVFGTRMQIQGPRAFVAADGTFEVRVVPGFHQLRLVDAGTGLLLASGSERVRVLAGADASLDIQASLHEVRIALAPEAEGKALALVDRIELRHTPKPDPKQGGRVQVFGGNDNYDQGIGFDVPQGATELRCFVPAGTLTVLARNNLSAIRVDKDRGNNPPLAREEFEVTEQDAAAREVTLKVSQPPEIADEQDSEKHEGEDAPKKRE